MNILNNLIEKKDITSYLQFRIKELKHNSDVAMKSYSEKDRSKLHKNLSVRRIELDRLLKLISKNKLRNDCKRMWRDSHKGENKK